VLGGTFRRIQFTPDLVPSDLVGTRIYRPDTGRFDTELGPVFGNFLLADEINRAPAKVQSALLEVMQERQVTIGGETFKVPASRSSSWRRRTRSSPRAPTRCPRRRSTASCSRSSSTTRRSARRPRSSAQPHRAGRRARAALARGPRPLRGRREQRARRPRRHLLRVQLADATRNPSRYGLEDLETLVDYGASPRGPISVIHAARSLALPARPRARDRLRRTRPSRPTSCATASCCRTTRYPRTSRPTTILDRVLAAVEIPPSDHLRRRVAA
jgi:MoxR-like ATPase